MSNQITIHPLPPEEPFLSPYQAQRASAPDIVNDDFLGGEHSTFKTVLDIINPLQQLPVVSTLYREMTGDTISTGARLAGGALLGGPVGFFLALANEVFTGIAGQDMGASMFAAATDKYEKTKALG